MNDLTAVPSARVRDVETVSELDEVLLSSAGTTAKAGMGAVRNYIGNGILNEATLRRDEAAAYAASAADAAAAFTGLETTFRAVITGAGQTSYTLPAAPASIERVTMSIGGVVQTPGDDFTLSGAVLSFSALPAGEPVVITAGQPFNLAVNTSYASRSTLVAARSGGFTPTNGVTYAAGGLAYVGATGSTAIPDLPGLEPAGVFAFLSQFGVVGDAVVENDLLLSGTDDTINMQAAFNWLAAKRGRRLISDPGKTYRISASITGTGHVNVDWNGSRVHVTANVRAFEFTAPGTFYDLSANYSPGDLVISTDTGSPLRPGQWVKIISDALDPANRDQGSETEKYRTGEWFQVGRGTTATSIVLASPLRFSRGISPTSTAGNEGIIDAYTTSMNARILVPAELDFIWQRGHITYEDGNEATWSGAGLAVYGYSRPLIEEHTSGRGYGAGIILAGTQQASVRNSRTVFLEDDTANSQFGYGVVFGGAVMTNIDGHLFQDTRHGVTTSNSPVAAATTDLKDAYRLGRTVGGTISNCQAFGFTGVAPFDLHHDAEDVTFVDCQAHNCKTFGFTIRGRNNRVVNPVVRNCKGGIEVFTDYNTGQADDDAYVNGRTQKDFTSCTIIHPDIHVSGDIAGAECDPVIQTRAATTDIVFGPPCRSVSHRFMKLRGATRISGHTVFEVTTNNGAAPLVDMDSEAAILVESIGNDDTGASLAAIGDRVVIESGADIRLECGDTGATGFVGVDLTGSTAELGIRGRLFIETPTTITQVLRGPRIATEDMGQVVYAVAGADDDSVTIGASSKQMRILALDGTVNIGSFQQGPYSTETAVTSAVVPADQRTIEAFYDSGTTVRRYRRVASGGTFQSSDGQHWLPVLIPGPYANDTAAASAGIEIGEIYRVTGGTLAWRAS